MTHLTEEERQCTADGTLAPVARVSVGAHLASCPECTRDVERIRAFLAAARTAAAVNNANAEDPTLWPAIRARIDAGKIVPLPAPMVDRRLRWQQAALAAAAAAIMIAAYLRTKPESVAPTAAGVTSPAMFTVNEQTAVYREQIDELLADLQLRRALLDPATVSATDHDLQVIDQAIAEVNAALERDPDNPALRQLLAESYHRKLDILKRVNNAS